MDKIDRLLLKLRKTLELARVLTTKVRKGLKDSDFAVPGKRKLPIHDCVHTRNAAARPPQTKGLTLEERRIANIRIQRKIRKCRGEG